MANDLKFSTDIQWLDTSKIKPNNYNPNYMPHEIFKSLQDDIKTNKFFGAIIINKNGIIIDGEHRYLALKKLGAKKIPVLIEDVPDDQAKILTVRINRERGYLTPMETGKLLTELQNSIPLDILSQKISIPEKEIALLTAIKYDPMLDLTEDNNPQISWSDIEKQINKLASEIKGRKIESISTVSRGGLIPARLLADKLNVQTILIDEDEITGDIFIDDIYDTGKTYRKVMKNCKNKKLTCLFLYVRKGTELPQNCIAGIETDDDKYIIFQWDKHEAKLSQK